MLYLAVHKCRVGNRGGASGCVEGGESRAGQAPVSESTDLFDRLSHYSWQSILSVVGCHGDDPRYRGVVFVHLLCLNITSLVLL